MEKLNVALVGLGRISDMHAAAYLRSDRARIYALCDLSEERLAARKSEWGVGKSYLSYEQLLADPGVDAVEILTPHLAHEKMCIAALEAGKHVAVQKPMTTGLASADRMVQAATAASTLCKVTDNYLFYPPLVLAKKMIDEGEIGEPLAMHLKYLGGGKGGWDTSAETWAWRIEERFAGRPLITFDHGHHLLAVAWFLFGEVERVSAWIDYYDGVVDTPAMVMWKHKEGTRYGFSDAVHAPELTMPSKYYANDEWYEISGTKGIILVRRCTGNLLDGPAVMLFDGVRWRDYDDMDSDWGAGFAGAAENFVDAVNGEAPALLTAVQGREVLRFSVALQRSAALRREVYLDELDSNFGPLLSWWRRRRERASRSGRTLLGRRKVDTAALAAQAWEVSRDLVAGLDAQTKRKIDFVVVLELREEAGVREQIGFYPGDGDLRIERGALPEDAAVTLSMPAGVWVAIVRRKMRIETALLRGLIKFEGKPELALRLRKAMGL